MAKGKLTPNRERFCQEYLIDRIGTQAYKRAYARPGYDPPDSTAGKEAHRLLKIPKIVARIQELIEERGERVKLEVSQDRVVTELAELAFGKERDHAKVASLLRLADHLGVSKKLPGDDAANPVHVLVVRSLDELPADAEYAPVPPAPTKPKLTEPRLVGTTIVKP